MQTFSAAAPEIFLTQSLQGNFLILGPDHFAGTISLQGGGIRGLELFMRLSGDTSVSFRNTAHFSLITDLPFTSQSGVFLSAVPLPAGIWLLLSGLGTLGLLRRNRVATTIA